MLNLLKGKKTYLISAISAVAGALQLLNGGHKLAAVQFLFAGAFGASLRAAVAKVEARVLSLLPKPVEKLVEPSVNAEISKIEG